jgi:cellulose synthase/poly-beta-1,6-N-acetylglucosamine synthase-like glycosyltransferase
MDADCEAHPECFLYAVPYFLADSHIGLISAFTLPKEPYTTWIDRMRMFELVNLMGLMWPASDVVDGIYCVPGTFTGFRREPVLALGGFIEGMYGEDIELTYSMARLGWHAVLDTRIRSYEDVPPNQRQLRIQRTRWNRGGTMSYSRNIPFVTGLCGPRFWFFATRRAVRRALMPLRLSLLTFLVAASFVSPTIHLNPARLAFILVFRMAPSVIESSVLCIYYRKGRQLAYLPLQTVFSLMKQYYALEACLSFNARAVVTPRIAEAIRPENEPTPGAVEVYG